MKKLAKLNQAKFLKACEKGIFEDVEYIFEKEMLTLDKDGNIFYTGSLKEAKDSLNFAFRELLALYIFHSSA
jgi:hypothetical protein